MKLCKLPFHLLIHHLVYYLAHKKTYHDITHIFQPFSSIWFWAFREIISSYHRNNRYHLGWGSVWRDPKSELFMRPCKKESCFYETHWRWRNSSLCINALWLLMAYSELIFFTKPETLKEGKSPVRFYKHWPLGREITIFFSFIFPMSFMSHLPPLLTFLYHLIFSIPSHHRFARFVLILLPSSSSSQFPPWQPVYWNQWALSCLHPDAATIFFLMSTGTSEEWYHYDHNYFEGKVQDEAI